MIREDSQVNANVLAMLLALPIRARVAVGLACAERSVRFLPGTDTQRLKTIVLKALRDAWAWEMDKNLCARPIYNQIYALCECTDEYGLQGAEVSAMERIISALYYAVRHADIHERRINPETPHLPIDICDVTDNMLIECLAYARAADGGDLIWQVQFIQRIAARTQGMSATEMGLPLHQSEIE
jgi:hypothetical protein